jgi:Domain of unknown function (DUF4900)
MQLKHRQRGVSLITSMIVIALVAAVILIMTGRTLSELQHSKDNSGIVQTLLLARGSARLGQNYLYSDLLKEHLKGSLTKLVKGSTKRWFFGDNTVERPSPSTVARDMKGLITEVQTRFDQDFCNQVTQPSGSTAIFKVRIYVTNTSCGIPLGSKVELPLPRLVDGAPRRVSGDPANPSQEQRQTYAIPFVLLAEGQQGDYKRNIAVQGELRFTAGKSTFARYAYFTNEDAEANLWFNSNVLIDGPIHTNSNFRFDDNPWFGGTVSSAGCQDAAQGTCNSKQSGGIFGASGNGAIIPPSDMTDPQNPSANGTTPAFTKGVDWNANYVKLPDNNNSQRFAALGRSKDNTLDLSTEGILFPTDLDSLTIWAGDSSEAALQPNGLAADGTPLWNPAASTYQYVVGCKGATCIKYRIDENKIIQKLDTTVNPNVWIAGGSRPFNGVIFAEGKIERLSGPARVPANSTNGNAAPPAIAKFSEITVASDEDIRITGDLKYEQPPTSGIAIRNPDDSVTPSTAINTGAVNVLGVYTAGGNILVGNQNSDTTLNAPNNVMVHASLMSSEGQITVEKFKQGSARGNFQLIGGMIQTRRGAFGTFSGKTMSSGYARTYTYDYRFLEGISPPFFPTAGESDPDNIFIFTFGQREQVF